MKNIKVLATMCLITFSLLLFSSCGKPKLTAEEVATQYITTTFKEDLRIKENQNKIFDLVHSNVIADDSIDYGVDFYDSIDEIVVGYTEDLECDKELVQAFKDAMIKNIEIQKKETTQNDKTTKVSFDVLLYTFNLENLETTLLESIENAENETDAINTFLTTCTEEINSKKFKEVDTLTILLEKDGSSWGVTGME